MAHRIKPPGTIAQVCVVHLRGQILPCQQLVKGRRQQVAVGRRVAVRQDGPGETVPFARVSAGGVQGRVQILDEALEIDKGRAAVDGMVHPVMAHPGRVAGRAVQAQPGFDRLALGPLAFVPPQARHPEVRVRLAIIGKAYGQDAVVAVWGRQKAEAGQVVDVAKGLVGIRPLQGVEPGARHQARSLRGEIPGLALLGAPVLVGLDSLAVVPAARRSQGRGQDACQQRRRFQPGKTGNRIPARPHEECSEFAVS